MKIRKILKNKTSVNGISICLLIFSFFFFLFTILSNQSTFTKKYNPASSQKKYADSQWNQSQNVAPDQVYNDWAKQKGYTGWTHFVDEQKDKQDIEKLKKTLLKEIAQKGISDSELYSYVGYRYMQGENPSLLNPEHPPLGKYLIGISILLFNNENVILLIIGFLCLILVFLITYLISHSLFSSSISTFPTCA